MKKFYFIGALMATSLSFGQVILTEDFNYTVPGNVGGATTTTTDATGSNNWLTHSNTLNIGGTIDVVAGNLSYTGLQSSTGNKISLAGNNATVPRDINRAITTSATTIYASFLLNVIDNTQLTATISGNNNYFFSIGQTAGTNITVLGSRLGITSSNAGANYRLHISNTTGGTPTYTENAVDLNFGQTYLVVVKFDRAAAPTTVNLWVNPSTLASEPAGSVLNNSGTGTFTAFASVVIRNASATPKAEIDEFRVGQTWADVTPTAPLSVVENNISGLKVYPNPAKTVLNITSNSFEVKQVELYDVLGKLVLSTKVTNASVNVSALSKGVYVVKVTEAGKSDTRKIVIE